MTTMHLRTVVSVSPNAARMGAAEIIGRWEDSGWTIEAVHISVNDTGFAVLRRQGDEASIRAEFARNLAGEVCGYDRGATGVWVWYEGQPAPSLDLDSLAKPTDHAQLRNLGMIRDSVDRLTEALRLRIQGPVNSGL